VVLDCSTGAKIQCKRRLFGLAHPFVEHGIQTTESPSSFY